MYILALLCFFLGQSCAVEVSSYQVKEEHQLPDHWIYRGQPLASSIISLKIGLRPEKPLREIEIFVERAATPGHPKYGQHSSAQAVRSLLEPSSRTTELVLDWLTEHGLRDFSLSLAGSLITINTTLTKAEDLLQANYSVFEHQDGSLLTRTLAWSLPEHLHCHVDVVQPTTSFFRPKAMKGMKRRPTPAVVGYKERRIVDHKREFDTASPSSCSVEAMCNSTLVTPNCIRCLYKTYDYVPMATQNNSMGICNYLNETNYRQDITEFMSQYRPDAIDATSHLQTITVNNGQNDQAPYTAQQYRFGTNIEGNLDAEYALAITYPTTTIAYNTGGMPPYIPDRASGSLNLSEPYLEWLEYVLSQVEIPQVISSSYGDYEQTVPESYARKVCSLFMFLAARGSSVFVASGDSGVGPSEASCVSTTDNSTKQFLPVFPATCPWVTAVGATQNFNPEIAV